MKRIFIIVISLVLVIACSDLKPYDSDLVKESMRTVMVAARAIPEALENGDYKSVSNKFSILEKEFEMLTTMKAPKGSNDQWIKYNDDIKLLAIEGQKAAESENSDEISRLLGEIFRLQDMGHKGFMGN